MASVLGNDRGSVLILAVIAMLIMGVLSVSFALLADIETKIGVNYKQQGQAEALAEAGLERARDIVRGAVSTPNGFTGWIGTVVVTDTLGAGQYEARVDNDCAPFVPNAIQQPASGGVSCPTNTDSNEVAVITARATAGSGRSRVRAILGVDNPWKHVCSSHKGDNGGYCNDPSNINGNPVITPADANDPNGPAAYDELPRPSLGCSQIDPTLHGATFAECVGVPQSVDYNPTTGTYSNPSAPPPGVRLVITGARTAALNCDAPGGDPNYQYSGYFDCALTTPCDNVAACNPIRPACVKGGDPRIAALPALYVPVTALGGCPGSATGMVFNWYGNAAVARDAAGLNPKPDQERNPVFDGILGGCNPGPTSGATFDCAPPNVVNGRNIYVLRGAVGNGGVGTGRVRVEKSGGGGESYVYGTLALEGDGIAAGCGEGAGAERDLRLLNRGVLTTGQNNSTHGRPVYGYPLAVVIFDPLQALGLDPPVRPASNPYDPQNTCADMGSANTAVNGMIYSGGHVQFNPIQINGSVVAFEIQTQGGANAGAGYNRFYGTATPPPGFPAGAGNQVVIIRKSFVVCTNYEPFTGGCN